MTVTSRMLRRFRRDESGQALVLALVIIVVGMALGLGAVAYALNVSGSASHDEHTRASQQAADAGVQTQLFDQNSGDGVGYKLNPTTNNFLTLANLLACEVPEVTGTQVVGKLALGVSSGPCPIQVAPSCATNASSCTSLTAPWTPQSNESWSESEKFPNPQLQGGSGQFPILFPDIVSLGCKTSDTTNGASTCNAPHSAAASQNSYAREMALLDPTAPLQAVEGENDVMIYSPGLLGQSTPTEVIDGNIVAGNTLILPTFSAPVTTPSSFSNLSFGGGSTAKSPSTLLGGATGQIASLSALHPILDYGYHCDATAFMGASPADTCGTNPAVSGGSMSLAQTGNASGANPCSAGSPATNCWLARPAFSLSALSAAGAPACPSASNISLSGGSGGCSGGVLDYTGNVTLTAPGTYVFCSVNVGGQLLSGSSGSGPIQIFIAGSGQDSCPSTGFAVAPNANGNGTGPGGLQGTAGLKINFSDGTSGGTAPYGIVWNFGDGTPGCVGTVTLCGAVSHTYNAAGTYIATETVTDATGLAESYAFTVIVTAPLVVGTPVCSLSAASGVSCTATASGGTPSASGYSYSWNFGDNGSRGDGAGSGTSGAVTSGAVSGTTLPGAVVSTGFDYATPGTYLISFTVTDSTGTSQTATKTLTDTQLNFTSTPATAGPVSQGTPTTFMAAGVSGGFGAYTYQWNFGDGGGGTLITGASSGSLTTASVPPVSYQYAYPGSYVARLTVTSADGQTVVASVNAAVTATAKTGSGLTMNGGTASASPATGVMPLSTTFSYSVGTCSKSGTAGTYSYVWNFGDGSATTTSPGPSHIYSAAGIYRALVTVTCTLSGVPTLSQIYAVTVVASRALIPFGSTGTPPSATASGSSVTFTGQGSDVPSSSTTYAYSWSFGDGSTGTSATASHTYSSPGTYTAVMTVTDGNSITASYDLTVMVAGVPPTASATASPNSSLPVRVGVPFGFTATITGGTTPYASYTWNWGDGPTASPDIQTIYSPPSNVYGPVSHTYTSAGQYLATLTVRDAAGLVSNTASVVVQVQPSAQSATAGGNFIVSGGINQQASDNVSGLINGATITTNSVDPAAFQIYMQGNPSDGLNAGTSTTDPSGLVGNFSTSSSYASVGGSGSFIDAFVLYAPRSEVNITAQPQGGTGGVFEGSAIGWNVNITALMILQDFNLANYPLSSVVNADTVGQTVECDNSVIPLTNASTDLNGCT